MSNAPKLRNTDSARKFAWNQYFKMVEINKVLCRKVMDFHRLAIDNNPNVPDDVKQQSSILYKTSQNYLYCNVCSNYLYEKTDEKTAITKCNHIFHKDCIDKLDVLLCPICGSRF